MWGSVKKSKKCENVILWLTSTVFERSSEKKLPKAWAAISHNSKLLQCGSAPTHASFLIKFFAEICNDIPQPPLYSSDLAPVSKLELVRKPKSILKVLPSISRNLV